MIKQSTIEAVKSQMQILEVVQEFVSLKKQGAAYVGLSPFTAEKTPSFNVIPSKEIFKDFSSGKGGDVISFLQEHQEFTFTQAIEWLANFYNIPIEYEGASTAVLPEPKITQRDAATTETDGEWYFEIRTEFTDFEIKTLLAAKVLDYISKDGEIDRKKAHEVFRRVNLYALESYTIIKNRKATVIAATDSFPIYMFDEGVFKKLYLPLNKGRRKKDGSPLPRFMYKGERPKNFLHGQADCVKAFNDLNQDNESMADEEEKADKKTKKLPEIIHCTGGSDAINILMLGYHVVWPNSETAKLTEKQFKKLQTLAEKVMNLPDIDATGRREAHRMAMQHLEMYTIELPESLAQKYDHSGNPCKDVRDYLRYYNYYDFKLLTSDALPYQFWETDYQKKKDGSYKKIYSVMNKRMYNFLMKNGFHRFRLETEKDGSTWIHRKDNIVKKIKSDDIAIYVHEFLESIHADERLSDTFFRTPQLSDSSLTKLKFIDIDFKDYTKSSQFFFFKNAAVVVSNKEIKAFKLGDIQRNVWESEVIDHSLPLEGTEPQIHSPHFKITKTPDGEFDIEILKKDNIFLNYLIQTSRIFWQKELEDSLEGLPPEVADKYREENKFNIAGPNLDPMEIQEQKQHLINKIFTLGYMLHRYKDPSRPWAPFGSDSKISGDGESHGGSGKSIFYKSLRHMMNTVTIDGKKAKLADDQFLWENVTPYTDYVLIDDLGRYVNFEMFFSIITGELTVNAKNTNRFIIDEQESPKIAMNSNFVPIDLHPSHRRRLIFNVFSDYYHEKTEEYQETRKPIDDFGRNLFKEDYLESDWVDTYQFMLQACHFYLTQTEKINPPMNSVEKRNMLQQMGPAFFEWADVYFNDDKRENDEAKRLDNFVSRVEAFDHFKKSTGSMKWSSQKFSKALSAWVKFYGYLLDPKEFQNGQGRIIRRLELPGQQKTEPMEVIYIRTKTGSTVSNEETPEPF